MCVTKPATFQLGSGFVSGVGRGSPLQPLKQGGAQARIGAFRCNHNTQTHGGCFCLHPPGQRVLSLRTARSLCWRGPCRSPLPSLAANRKAGPQHPVAGLLGSWPPLHRPGSDRRLRVLGPGNAVLCVHQEAPGSVRDAVKTAVIKVSLPAVCALGPQTEGEGAFGATPSSSDHGPHQATSLWLLSDTCFHGHAPAPWHRTQLSLATSHRSRPELLSSAMNRVLLLRF